MIIVDDQGGLEVQNTINIYDILSEQPLKRNLHDKQIHFLIIASQKIFLADLIFWPKSKKDQINWLYSFAKNAF